MHTFTELSKILNSPELFGTKPVIFIVDKTGTALVPSFLYQILYIRKMLCRVRDVTATEPGALAAELSSTLLDSRLCYILYGVSERSKKNSCFNQEEYTGPHTLLCVVPEVPKKSSHPSLVVPALITLPLFSELTNLVFCEPVSTPTFFMQHLFSRHKQISFQAAYAFLFYQRFISGNDTLFFSEWVDRIVVSEESLFDLSSAFFSKQRARTFELWKRIKNLYPPAFWSVYWSEQLFRALLFCSLKEKQAPISPTYSYRLPFSFIQRDWRSTNAHDLVEAHDMAYSFDQHSKMGGFVPFELMIALYCKK